MVERDGLMLWATASDVPGVAQRGGPPRSVDPGRPRDHGRRRVVRRPGHRVHGERGRGRRRRPAGRGRGRRAARAARQPADGLRRAGRRCPPPEPASSSCGSPRRRRSTTFADLVDTAYQSLGAPAGAIRPSIVALDRVLEPHVETVLALLDGEPVACAQLLLSHGMGGVYYVGTLEAARGRGLGELVTARGHQPGLRAGRGRSSGSRPHPWASPSTAAWATATSTARPASSASRPPPPDPPPERWLTRSQPADSR